MKAFLCTIGVLVCCLGYGQSVNDSIPKLKNGVGIYIAYSQHAFSRERSLISNPFVSNNFKGVEIGVRIPIINSGKYSNHLFIGYSGYGVNEYFEDDDSGILESSVVLNGIKVVSFPLSMNLKLKKANLKMGAGAFGIYNITKDFSTDPVITNDFDIDRINNLVWGWAAQVGIQYNHFILDLNIIHSISDFMKETAGDNPLKIKGVNLSLSYLF
jgi:hypothetical protein